MNQFILFVFLSVCFFGCESSIREIDEIKLSGWNYDWMLKVKNGLENEDAQFLPAYEYLLSRADEILENEIYSVTFKSMLPASNSPHDYSSMGPYWWPDPEKKDGLPYINRDGEVNPERDALDSHQLYGMMEDVRTLALAWFFSNDDIYAEKGLEFINAWFLDPNTRMNPHLEYSQNIPGRTPGRYIGIIDGRGFHVLVDAIKILEHSDAFSESIKNDVFQWFTLYYKWLKESDFGNEVDKYKNNHSVAYDVQVMGVALFIGDEQQAKWKVRELPRKRIDSMIESDGRQPKELERTRAFGYSVANLENFLDVVDKGLRIDVDVSRYENSKGGSIEKALKYLIEYIDKEAEWPYEQISDWIQTENRLGLLVRRASYIYDDDSYKDIWNNVFRKRLNNHWNLLVYPEKD